MKPYPKYKDSGIEWIGEIPEHWNVKRIKYLIKRDKKAIKTGPFGSQLKNEDMCEEGVKVYNQRNVLDNNFTSGSNFISCEKYAELKDFEIFPDDILITTRGTIGKCAVFPHEADKGVLHPCLMRIQVDQDKVLNPYVEIYIQDSALFTESVFYNSNATTIEVIYSDTLKQVQLPIPPLHEQKTLLNCIKLKTSQIDSLIEKKQKMIELLKEYRTAVINHAVTKGLNSKVKMKDSGIDWLGEIPEHWKVIKLKYTASLINEKVEVFENNELRIALENIESFTGKLINGDGEEILFEGSGNRFKEGDVLFNKLRPYLCKAVLAPNSGVSVGELLVLRPNESLENKFLFYQVLSNCFISVVNGASYGTKMPRASWEFIGNLKLPLPPVKEQLFIATYLDKKINEIESLIEKEEASISILRQYRTALISNAVTGKIDVRNIA